jgi:hypothetical protein
MISNLLAIHAKRVTLKVEDMRLLRDLWKRITPDAVIGADNAHTRRSREIAGNIARRESLAILKRLKSKIERLRLQGRLHTLTTGERNLANAHNVNIG